MINVYNQVPSVYVKASRDFQYLSWLINIVLNSVKHNVDDLYDLPNTKADSKLIELLAMTLGFKVKRNYNQKQLAVLVSILPSILKYKGTIKAVALAGNALINASGADVVFDYDLENNCLKAVLPAGLVDINLFTDLLPYILPAGITCKIVRKPISKPEIDKILVGHSDRLVAKLVKREEFEWADTTQTVNSLANLYNVDDSKEPNFATLTQTDEDIDQDGYKDININAGLLDSSVIPRIENPLVNKNRQEEN